MTFNTGDRVIVIALNKHGNVLSIDPKGIITVLIGNMTLKCKAKELRFVAAQRSQSKKATLSIQANSKEKTKEKHKNTRVDLHGLTVAQAQDLIDENLNSAVLNNIDIIEIVHGIGTGKLKEATHKLLRSRSVVESFKWDPINPGVTIVYL